MRTKIAAGNWKMNGTRAAMDELTAIASHGTSKAEVIICPPLTLLSQATLVEGVNIGAQNAHMEANGAYTGEISMEMLTDLSVTHVILGHSERREMFGETDAIVRAKVAAAHAADLVAILCVGETADERQAGQAEAVVGTQLSGSIPEDTNAQNTIIAYEPVWCIGTGLVASNDDIAAMHGFIRGQIPDANNMRVLYGGSVKPTNAAEIFAIADVDGGLVGGASLKATDFVPIIHAADQLS